MTMHKGSCEDSRGDIFAARFFLGLLIVILLAGIYARWADLAWHFTNNDDLRIVRDILMGAGNVPRVFTVPALETNAPFQFLFTTFLISPLQDYRELLFWGRLPSCVFGILALFAMVYFYRRWEAKDKGSVLLGTALLACSWENIIYAKQTYSYAVGVLGLVLMLGFFSEFVRRAKYSLGQMLALSFGLALVSNMQYQIYLFIPSFFIVFFLHQWFCREDKKVLALHFLLAVLFYVLLVAPTWYFLLWDKLGRADPSWIPATGPRVIFALGKGASFLKFPGHTVMFLARSLFIVFRCTIGFFEEPHPLFMPVSYLFFTFFLLGLGRCILARDRARRLLAVFFIISIGSWWGLVVVNKMMFVPSRQTLILLPFFCVMITEGVSFLLGRLFPDVRRLTAFGGKVRDYTMAGLAVGVLSLFLIFFGQFLAERRDLANEKDILKLMKSYSPDLVAFNSETFGFTEMKELNRYFQEMLSRQGPDCPYKTVAFLSRYPVSNISWEECEKARARINLSAQMNATKTGNPASYLKYPCQAYHTVYFRKIVSPVQTDFTKINPIELYQNNLYIYIFRRN